MAKAGFELLLLSYGQEVRGGLHVESLLHQLQGVLHIRALFSKQVSLTGLFWRAGYCLDL